MFGHRTINCQDCGKEIDRSLHFCPHCGASTNTRMGKCPYCGQKTDLNAKHCGHCGRELGTQREPAVQDRVWRASRDDFAVHLDPQDVDGRFFKHIEIQPGQQAILLVDGRSQEERRGPGTYTVKTLFGDLLSLGHGRRVRALVVQGGPMVIDFDLRELKTADAFEIAGQCEVAVAVANPAVFFANVMRQEKAYTTADLRRLLFNQVRDAVQEVVGSQSVKELATGMRMKEQIVTAVERHLAQTLQDSGLSVREVRVANFSHPRFDKLRGVWEDIRLRQEEVEADTTMTVAEKKAELDKRQRLWQVEAGGERQETDEQREKAHIFAERAQVWEEMRRALMSDRANAIRTEEDFADFLAKIDHRKVLRQEDLDILKEQFANRKQDRHAARAQLAYLAQLERDYERKRAELAQRSDFTLEQMAAALKIEQQKLADAGLMDEQRWGNEQAELLREAERVDWKRTEQVKWDEFEREQENAADVHRRKLQKAKVIHALELESIVTDAELSESEKRAKKTVELARFKKEERDITRAIKQADFDERVRQVRLAEETRLDIEAREDEQDLKTADTALDLLKKMKQNKLDAEARAREIARQDDLTRQKAAHDQAIEQRRLDLEAAAQEQSHELATLQARAEMSAEALISLSSPEQAKVIAELKSTEALKGMSDDAIFAMMAKDSAPLAAALAEKFKAMQEQPELAEKQLAEVKKLYDQMVVELQKDKDRQSELNERTQQRFQEMFNKALDSQKDGMVDITRATSHPPQAPQSPNIVVVPGGGSTPQVIQTGGGTTTTTAGGGGGKVQVCPQCHAEMPVGTKFCTNCGYKFYE